MAGPMRPSGTGASLPPLPAGLHRPRAGAGGAPAGRLLGTAARRRSAVALLLAGATVLYTVGLSASG